MSSSPNQTNPKGISKIQWLPETRQVVTFLLVAIGSTVCAQEKNLYFGVSTTLANIDATWNKTVDNSLANSQVPDSRRGRVFIDKDDIATGALGLSFLAGYRLPIAYKDYYFSVEFDVKADRSDIQGRLLGIGSSAGKNQLGESWPDDWKLDGTNSRGATLKITTSPGILSTIDMALHVLVGMRRLDTTFTSQYYGCLAPTPCSEEEGTPDFTSGSEQRDIQVDGWTIGAGFGKELGEKLVLRIETRITQYDEATWEDFFDDVNVNVPSKLDTEDLGFSIGLIKYF